MYNFDLLDKTIEQAVLNIHTAFLARVTKVNGNRAIVNPLESVIPRGGEEQIPISSVSVIVPPNVKYEAKAITYRVGADSTNTTTVLVPAELEPGDIVYVGICERDITNAYIGSTELPTRRHHDINDGVILKVL